MHVYLYRESVCMLMLEVALSATLPNYVDVANFMRVEGENLFYFDSAYRPIPLEMSFIGLTENNPLARLAKYTEVFCTSFWQAMPLCERNPRAAVALQHVQRAHATNPFETLIAAPGHQLCALGEHSSVWVGLRSIKSIWLSKPRGGIELRYATKLCWSRWDRGTKSWSLCTPVGIRSKLVMHWSSRRKRRTN